jgi:hypothetical protein
VARIGDFDKDSNLQGWFDETLANAPRGWFDKSAINGNDSDTQTAHGGDAAAAPAAPAKTTRAHDRPLEWWKEAAEQAWLGDQAKAANDQGQASVEELAAWWNDQGEKQEKQKKQKKGKDDVYVHGLPLDSRDDNVYVLPLRSFESAPEEPLDYMRLGALERAAGLDTTSTVEKTSGWVSLHPVMRVALSSLVVLGAWHLITSLGKSPKEELKRKMKKSGRKR